jgi:hypothetical protein
MRSEPEQQFEFLKSFDLDALLLALKDAYEGAFIDHTELTPAAQMAWFKKSLRNIGGAFKQYISKMEDIVQASAHIRKLIHTEPNQELRVAYLMKLQKINDIFGTIQALIKVGNEPKDQAANASRCADLIAVICGILARTEEHKYALSQLALDPADTIFFCIGAGDNPYQAVPEFIKDPKLAPVSIYYFDDAEEKGKLPADDSGAAKHLLAMSIYFADAQTRATRWGTKHTGTRVLDTLLDQQIKDYVAALKDKKSKNPNFKFILLYCCTDFLDQDVKALAWKLAAPTASGVFTPGRDLWLVHTYEKDTPAVVFADFSTLSKYHHLYDKTLPRSQVFAGIDQAELTRTDPAPGPAAAGSKTPAPAAAASGWWPPRFRKR